MKRSAANTCWSSESCKKSDSSTLIAGNRVGIQNGDNECSFSSENSCGQDFHVRKRRKSHLKLECSSFNGKNRKITECCNNAASQQAELGHSCCPGLEEAICPMKSMLTLNPTVWYDMKKENDEFKCSLKQHRCQHCVSSHLCRRCLPFDCCDGFHNGGIFNQEEPQLTASRYCEQRKCSSVWGRHIDCVHHQHPSCNCDSPLCQQKHAFPAGMGCRRECCRSSACMKAKSEKNLASVGKHGSGDRWQENTKNGSAPAAESLKAKDKSRLILNGARPPNIVTAECKVDDICLGLAEGVSSGDSQLNKDLDLNNIEDDDPKSSPDMCAPATPFLHNSDRKLYESLQTNINDKGATKVVNVACGDHRIQGNTVILVDDSDEEVQQNVNQESMPVSEIKNLQQQKSIPLPLDKGLAGGVESCQSSHMLLTKQVVGCENESAESFDMQSNKCEKVAAALKSRLELNEGSNISAQIFEATESSVAMALDTHVAAVHPDLAGSFTRGFRPRKKCIIDKKSLPLFGLDATDDEDPINANIDSTHDETPPSESDIKTTHGEDDPSNIVTNSQSIAQKAALANIVETNPRMWESSTICDLCHKGLSLSLGEWYAWCCGLPLRSCSCSLGVKMRFTLAITPKKSNRSRKIDGMIWSGKVHKMCALWSSEVYENGDKLVGLSHAVRRGKSLVCAACKEYGATLGCRVKTCRRSFHYPCADELASKLCCRMWDGVHYPVACRGHRHVPMTCQNAKERPPDLKKWRFKGLISRRNQTRLDRGSSLPNPKWNMHITDTERSEQQNLGEAVAKEQHGESSLIFIDISTDSEREDRVDQVRLQNPSVQRPRHLSSKSSLSNMSSKNYQPTEEESGQSWKEISVPLYYMGTNLLSEDISGGHEAVIIPCTNDLDSDPAPDVSYIIENRYLGRAKSILDSLLHNNELHAAPACNGCDINDMDDPKVKPSVHSALNNSQRESDSRYDWQGQSMLGRLPYDRFGRLQLGPQTKDIMECNSRCPCGVDCLNKELQKGIRIPLEVFKTKDRGWGVRTMEHICRGKFVMEYIGEVLTHDEAYVRGVQYDLSNSSCLFSADHPDVPAEDLLVIDGYQMSNVARFINHSCDGNLRVYRVYSETTDLRFCRIGLYALRDIEIGEELSYDYSYVTSKDTENKDFSTDPTAIKCLCGASNCRQWLWTGSSR